jgi:hypothetical protein
VLYVGDLFDTLDIPDYRWLYDSAQIALTLRSDYLSMQLDAKLHLADLLASSKGADLSRAAELYVDLYAEEPEDERLWIGLFHVYERAGSLLGLQSAERRLRAALAEMRQMSGVDAESVTLPPKLETLLAQIRERLSAP